MNVGLLCPLLKDRYAPLAVKVLIYRPTRTTILRLILTYGCEAWTLTVAAIKANPGNRNEVDETHQRCHTQRLSV